MASKVSLIVNPKYQRNGLKSYVHLIRKYGFNPTLAGPYFHATTISQQGKFSAQGQRPVGGRARVKRVLQKKTGDQTGDVPADDVQNDSMYLAQVGIGSPAQTLKLDFDTGSADLWVCPPFPLYTHIFHIRTKEIYEYDGTDRALGLVDRTAFRHQAGGHQPHYF